MWCLYGVGRRHRIDSCLYLAAWAEGKEIRTLEVKRKAENFLMFSRLMRNPASAVRVLYAWPDYGYHGNAGEPREKPLTITEIRRGLAGNLFAARGIR